PNGRSRLCPSPEPNPSLDTAKLWSRSSCSMVGRSSEGSGRDLAPVPVSLVASHRGGLGGLDHRSLLFRRYVAVELIGGRSRCRIRSSRRTAAGRVRRAEAPLASRSTRRASPQGGL